MAAGLFIDSKICWRFAQ